MLQATLSGMWASSKDNVVLCYIGRKDGRLFGNLCSRSLSLMNVLDYNLLYNFVCKPLYCGDYLVEYMNIINCLLNKER